MPSTIVYDCPHCSAKNNGFSSVGSIPIGVTGVEWRLFFQCNSCFEILVICGEGLVGGNPSNITGNLANAAHFKIKKIYPQAEKIQIPDYLPNEVFEAFEEGCLILKTAPRSACTSFRRALEFGLKGLSPEIEAWKLEKRIDKMASNGLITTDLRDWAHQLRIDGNEATHEGELSSNSSKDQWIKSATDMRELTRFVLTYLFTLPKQVEIARGNKSNCQ